MPFQDEEVRFERSGDTGENDQESIQPVDDGEANWEAVFNRSPEHLRQRTEILRATAKTLKYLADYDRGFILNAGGAVISCTKVYSSPNRYKIALDGAGLSIFPALTPGKTSGGRPEGARLWIANVPYAGIIGVNDLTLVAHRGHTGIRGYADATSLAEASGHSIGANDTSVELIGESRSGGPASIQVTVTGTPRRRIRIAYGNAGTTPTTLADLITFINTDTDLGGTEPGGTFGLMNLLYASTTCSTPSSVIALSDFPETYLQGGYDAEEHYVSKAQIDAFFAIEDNLLYDGECMALFFASEVEASPTAGGRRQSLPDLPIDKSGAYTDNTYSVVTPYGNLFNTGREPEKVPGALPLVKVVGGEVVFIDGTRLADGKDVTLGENYITRDICLDLYTRLAAETAARLAFQTLLASVAPDEGTALVGFRGTVPWHNYTADDAATLPSARIPQGTLQNALDVLVQRMGQVDVNNSGARRIGVEGYAGVVSYLNEAKKISLSAMSVRQQLRALLDGINTKVSDTGWNLKGLDSLRKTFSIEAPSGGGKILEGALESYGNLGNAGSTTQSNLMSLLVQPIDYNDGTPSHTIRIFEDCNYVPGPGTSVITLTGGTIGVRFPFMRTKLPIPSYTQTYPPGGTVNYYIDHVLVQLTGVTVGATDMSGYYRVIDIPGTAQLQLQNLDGTLPDFSTYTFTGAGIAFLGVIQTGSNAYGNKIRAFHAGNGSFASFAQMNDQAPFLENWHYDVGEGDVIRNMRVTPGRILLRKNAIDRDSEHILIAGDFAQLNGVETGSAPEVTTNHKHDNRYTPMEHFYDRSAIDMNLRAYSAADNSELSGTVYLQRGTWQTGIVYNVNDVVYVCDTPSASYGYFTCVTGHTSTTFAADITKWALDEAFPVQIGATSYLSIAGIDATDNHVFDKTALFYLLPNATNIDGFQFTDIPHMWEIEVEIQLKWKSGGSVLDHTPHTTALIIPVIRNATLPGTFTQQLMASDTYAHNIKTISMEAFDKSVPTNTYFREYRQRVTVHMQRLMSVAPSDQYGYIGYKTIDTVTDSYLNCVRVRLIKTRVTRF